MRRPIDPGDLLAIATIADVQLAPGGERIAYTLTTIDAEADEYRSSIWVVPTRGDQAPIRFTRGPRRDLAPRWSPDGTRLAFLSDRDGATLQLYVMPADGGEPRKLIALDHDAGPAVWSPDGRQILCAARVPLDPAPVDPDARRRWALRPRVVDRASYKADGSGYVFDTRSRLFVIGVDEGRVRPLTDADGDDRAPAWSLDGRRIAFSRTRTGLADYNVSDIWIADADGSSARRLTEEVGRAASPAWSPDGATIACYGTDEQQSGFGEPLVRVWTVPATGGSPRRVTADYDRGVFLLPPPTATPGPVWSADGVTLTFIAADAGNLHVVRASVPDGTVRSVVSGERQISLVTAAPAIGRLAFVASQPDDPGDVYTCAWDGGNEQRLTRVNDALLVSLALPRVERRTFQSPHGSRIEGWLMRPGIGASESGGRPAPLLLHIHGGPHAFAGSGFQPGAFYGYVLASRGWAVLALNPSGSGSYGRAFAHSLRGRWGEYDLPEQLGAVDALVMEGIADRDRLAVAGYSYGGYMTAWTIGHTDRFKAAVIGAPVTNLESFHGTSDIGMWFGPFEMRGDLVPNRETYRRLSPVNYVEHVTTPTLILHGEADDRCPIGQGEEFYAGLVAAGKAPAAFVRYPGSSHLFAGTGRPSHRVDYARRVVEWVLRYTTPPEAPAEHW